MAGRRGRRSRDDYIEAVVPLVRADMWRLKDELTFTDQPGVKALASQFKSEAWPLGLALYALIAGAVVDVYAGACAGHSRHAQRTAEFLHLWYDEQQTVSSIAAGMHLSRSHVAKAIQRPAVLLVAQRFLALAQQTDPAAQSDGLRQVLSTRRRQESRANPKDYAGFRCSEPI
jgi:hypothetical protein